MYDENLAIKYIKSQLPADWSCEEDDILLLIDSMFDYYEENDDFGTEEEPAVKGLVEYVKKALEKDKLNTIKPEYVEQIVKAELEYESQLDEDDEL